MIIDCISDLHGFYPKLEGGDLLIVAGDLTASDTPDEYTHFEKEWLRFQPYTKKIVIAGNHDNWIQNNDWVSPNYYEYLQDSGTEFDGLKIWGSPWTLAFEDMNPVCKAFTCETEAELEKKWALIPPDVDILITHSPPHGILDQVSYIIMGEDDAAHVGSHSLRYYCQRHHPRLHVFGHIHEAYGTSFYLNEPYEPNDTIYVNASHVNERYKPVNPPIRILI